MTRLRSIKEMIEQKVWAALNTSRENGELSFEGRPGFMIEVPREKSHGDFAVNVALLLAKTAKKSPRVIAELVKNHIAVGDGP